MEQLGDIFNVWSGRFSKRQCLGNTSVVCMVTVCTVYFVLVWILLLQNIRRV